MAPSLLIGHSLGGAAVLRLAAEVPDIRAVATIGAPFDPAHVTHNFGDAIEAIERDGAAEVTLAGRPFVIGKQFLDDVTEAELTPAIRAMKAALLVLHGPLDRIVGIENAQSIFLAARHPKSFVTLDKADHLLSDPVDAEYAAEVIAAWAGRYLDLPDTEAKESVPEGIVRVSEADAGGFLQDIQSGPAHHMVADEPKAFGGTDLGMSPYGFLAAGLGACTSMTIRMYARRKKLPLTHVSVDVSHDKTHKADADGGGGKIDVFSRVIHLAGDLSSEQRETLLAIADKCPVHRTLEASARIETRLAEDSTPT